MVFVTAQGALVVVNEAPPRQRRGGFLERNTERPLFIRTLKGAVFWPRMYKSFFSAQKKNIDKYKKSDMLSS